MPQKIKFSLSASVSIESSVEVTYEIIAINSFTYQSKDTSRDFQVHRFNVPEVYFDRRSYMFRRSYWDSKSALYGGLF